MPKNYLNQLQKQSTKQLKTYLNIQKQPLRLLKRLRFSSGNQLCSQKLLIKHQKPYKEMEKKPGVNCKLDKNVDENDGSHILLKHDPN